MYFIKNTFWSTGIRFFGCSEAKHKHDFGCDKDKQNVDVKDKSDKKIQVWWWRINSFFFDVKIRFKKAIFSFFLGWNRCKIMLLFTTPLSTSARWFDAEYGESFKTNFYPKLCDNFTDHYSNYFPDKTLTIMYYYYYLILLCMYS